MIGKRFLFLGLLSILVIYAVVARSIQADGLLNALPLTFVILFLTIRRFVASLNEDDNDDNPSSDENNNLTNE